MEEKTPVGSNAPIEESTEKKTSPAGSNSPSAAPAAGGSRAAGCAGALLWRTQPGDDIVPGFLRCPGGEQFAHRRLCGCLTLAHAAGLR